MVLVVILLLDIGNMENKEFLTSQIYSIYDGGKQDDPKGLKKIDSGHNRIVYRVINNYYGDSIKGRVIKISYQSSYENKQESLAWDKYKDTDFAKYLVPILDHSEDFSWILMPYGEPVPSDLVDKELLDILKKDLGGSDISELPHPTPLSLR